MSLKLAFPRAVTLQNSILFIEGRKFVFGEHEVKLLQDKLDSFLKEAVII